ncbi:MAG: aminopeptidase [Pseudothermotoga sp.]
MKFSPKNLWSVRDRGQIESFTEEYAKFIDLARTERMAIREFEKILQDAGYVSIESYDGKATKVYAVNRGKSLIALHLTGKLEDGLNLVAAHIDAPRLDLKPQPLFEEEKIALARTHYYGGVKKYQWLSLPLELHGHVVKDTGEIVEIHLGQCKDDPVFVAPDLLPHLDKKDALLSEKFDAEKLSVVFGTIPLAGIQKEAVKTYIMKLLSDRYGLKEEDFVSGEFELVPALKARSVGFDESLLGAYGHDDRICAYTAIKGLIDVQNPLRSCGVILFDREEIGSEGNAGAKANFYVMVLKKILKSQGCTDTSLGIDELFSRTNIISADVCPAIDPMFKEVHDLANAARVGYGIGLVRYTGSGGKSGSSEAHAEFVAKVRKVLNQEDVVWQVATMGKVDRGGGGTVAKFLAEKGACVLDMGPALLGMHSPFELVSKADLYETYRAYRVLLEKLN